MSSARIEAAKTRLKRAEDTKIVKQTQLEAAEKQKEEIVGKMAQEGVTPETIKEKMDQLTVEVDKGLEQIETILPNV